ncbi:hypothetical protein F4775DRAFT_604130 [Biscogniauxia sp. FL1348]|nr:hypothetical protein F4775DRAFT_604130 [Biscogniauxia sp. FL1348]
MVPISPHSDMRSSPRSRSPRTATTNDLLPAPLRIPQRKTDNVSDDVEEPEKEVQAPQPPPILTMAQRRGTGSKLGSLVSKFEILDAVNKSIRVKRSLQLQNSLSSEGSSGISPRQGVTPITPKRSMIPISTRSREAVSNGLSTSGPKYSPSVGALIPVDYQDPESLSSKGISGSRSARNMAITTNRKPVFQPKETSTPSPGSTSVTPSPTDTEVRKWPAMGSEDPSPRRLPVSKSSREKSLRKGKSPHSPSVRTFETAQSSNFSYEDPGHPEPEKETTEEYEATPAQVKSTRSQKPSVADLRMSFERISQPSTSIPATPIRPKSHSKPSTQRSPRRSQDVAHPFEVSHFSESLPKQTPIRRSHDASQIQSSPLSRNYLTELKGRKSGSGDPGSLVSLPIKHSPASLLPRSNQSHRRRTLLPKLNTAGTFVSFESEPIDLELRGSGRGPYKESPGDHTSASGKGLLITESPIAPRLRHYPMSQSKQTEAAGEPHTPANRSLLPKSHTIPRPSSKSEPVSRRSTKVSDLRKLFDRPSIRGSSPIPFMNFRRGRGRTMPFTAQASAPELAFFSGEPFATTSTWQKKRAVVVPPELTTEISVNDFACNFVDAPASESGHHDETSAPTKEQSIKTDSPVKEHIHHFERLDRGSPSCRTAPSGRAKSYDTGRNLRFPFGKGEKSKQRSAAGGWGTAMWRRISSSLSYSLDGCDDNNNDPQSSSSVHLPAQPEKRQHGHHQHHRRRSSLLLFGGYHHHHHHHGPSDTTTTMMADRSTTAYSSYGGGGSSINLNLNLEDAFLSPTTLKNGPSCVNYTRSSLSPPPLPQQPQLYQRLPMRKSLPLLARRIRLSSSFGTGLELATDPDPDLGLDGALQSTLSWRRKGRDHDRQGEGEGERTNSPDPGTLPKVMPKQSAAERWRRKQEEKQMRRAARQRRREVSEAQAQVQGQGQGIEKGKGKGKGKAVGVEEEEESKADRGRGEEEAQERAGEEWGGGGGGGEVEGADGSRDKKKKESSWGTKTASGFVVRQATDVSLRHPKPRRPGQVRKLVNMYREKAAKAASGHSIGSVGGGGGGGSSSSKGGNGVA